MKIKILLCCFILLSSLNVVAQNQQQYAVVRGYVYSAQDTVPLFGASVILSANNTGAPSRYKGFFSLPRIPYGNQELTVSYMGYKTQKVPFTANKDTVYIGRIYLVPDEKTLKEVEVKGAIPMMVQKGDTMQYNAAAFKTKPDATALDLVAKMPGISTDNGMIKSQGTKVEKIYLNGSEFFGDNPMKALSYLPANSVYNIKVYEEAADQSKITDSDSESLIRVMNVQTVGNEKKLNLGTIKAAGGSSLADNTGLYQFNGSAVVKIPNHTIGIGATINNLNNGVVTDYMQMPAGQMQHGNQPGLVKAAELSYSYEGTKLKIDGQYAGSLSTSDRFSNTQFVYYPQLPIFNSKMQDNTNNTSITTNNQRGDISLRWMPNPKNTFIFNSSFSINNSDNLNTVSTLTIQDADTVSRSHSIIDNKSESYSVSGRVYWSHKFDKKGRSLSVSSSYGVSGNSLMRNPSSILNENYNITTNKWTSADLSSNRLMDGNNKNNTLYAQLQYTEPLLSKSRAISKQLQYSVNLKHEWGNNNNRAFSFDSLTSAYTKPDTARSSAYNKGYNTIDGRISYSYRDATKGNGNLNYTLSADIIQYERERADYLPFVAETNQNVNSVEPRLSVKYNKYSFNYNGRTLLPSIESLTPYINDINPMNLTVGNLDLKNGYRHSISLSYNNNSAFNPLFQNKSSYDFMMSQSDKKVPKSYAAFGFNLTASSESNPISVNRISLPVNRDTVIYISSIPNDTIGNGYRPQRGAMLNKYVNLGTRYNLGVSGNLDFSVPFTKNVIKLIAGYTYSNASSLYQGVLNRTDGHTVNLNTTITSYAWENVDYSIVSNSTFGYTKNSLLQNSRYFNETLVASLSVVLPKDFVVETNINWMYSKSYFPENPASAFALLNFNIGKLFLKNRNAKITLNGYDLLNQSKNRIQFISNDYISYNRTNTFGRYVMLKFTYNFNSLKRATHEELKQRYNKDNSISKP